MSTMEKVDDVSRAAGPRAPGLGPRAEQGSRVGALLGGIADFTIGTAIVLWHAALAGRDRRRRAPIIRAYSSTR
jgi:hypothetical protein